MYTETFESPQILERYLEPDSPHLAKIKGRFIREGARSANKRVYENVAPWIGKVQAKIDAGGIVDMRTCHSVGDKATEIAGRVTQVNTDGTYEALIPNNPVGQTILPLLRGGYLKHVSLRAKKATMTPIAATSPADEGWVTVTDVDDFAGIDYTNSPGLGESSVELAENDDREVILESFSLAEQPDNDLDDMTCPCCGSDIGGCTCDADCTCRHDGLCSPTGHENTLVTPEAVFENVWEADARRVAAALLLERFFSADDRRKLATSGAAMADGSFPITDRETLEAAIKLAGNAKNPDAARAHIKKRAKALGLENAIPDTWENAGNPAHTEAKGATDTMPTEPTGALDTESTPALDIAAIIKEHTEHVPTADSSPDEVRTFLRERGAAVAQKVRSIVAAGETAPDGAEGIASIIEAAIRVADPAPVAPTTDPKLTEALSGLSAALASGDSAKVTEAHAALASALGVPAQTPVTTPEPKEPTQVTEAATIQDIFERTVATVIEAADARVAAAVESMKTEREAHEAEIKEMLGARRKSHALLEHAKPEDLAREVTLEDAVRAALRDTHANHLRPTI